MKVINTIIILASIPFIAWLFLIGADKEEEIAKEKAYRNCELYADAGACDFFQKNEKNY